ncbi:MAG: pitrilysin family protein [Polyangiales bacterium]
MNGGSPTTPVAAVRAHEGTLDTGLRVVAVPQSALHRVHVGLFVSVGSRHETRADNGITHFLEHMLYRGTARLPTAHRQNLAFERLGGTLSAATLADHTYIGITVPPASLGGVLELLGEVLVAPKLGDIELERRIVREEILEDLDEDGRQIDPDNVTRATAFGDHPLGFTITGPAEGLDRFDERALRAHLARFYVARNSVLAVGGACDAGEVMALAKKHLRALPTGAAQRPVPFEPVQKGVRRRHVASPGSQTDLRISFVTPGEHDPQAAAIELLLRCLDDGMSTRLYHRLCDDGGLVYDTHASWEPYDDCGIFDVTAEAQHTVLPEVVSTILATLHELAVDGPTEDELDKARARHRWTLEAALDGAEDLVALLGGAVFFRRPVDLAAQAARFDRLAPSDVAAAARTVFRRNRMQFVTVGTLHGKVRDRVRASVSAFGR